MTRKEKSKRILEKYYAKEAQYSALRNQPKNRNTVIITAKPKPKPKQKKKISRWDILLNECRNLKYNDFLQSRYWKMVVSIVKQRDNNKCTICGSTVKLCVHHTTYKIRLKEHKNLDKLITLCDKCHYDYHCKFEVN